MLISTTSTDNLSRTRTHFVDPSSLVVVPRATFSFKTLMTQTRPLANAVKRSFSKQGIYLTDFARKFELCLKSGLKLSFCFCRFGRLCSWRWYRIVLEAHWRPLNLKQLLAVYRPIGASGLEEQPVVAHVAPVLLGLFDDPVECRGIKMLFPVIKRIDLAAGVHFLLGVEADGASDSIERGEIGDGEEEGDNFDDVGEWVTADVFVAYDEAFDGCAAPVV